MGGHHRLLSLGWMCLWHARGWLVLNCRRLRCLGVAQGYRVERQEKRDASSRACGESRWSRLISDQGNVVLGNWYTTGYPFLCRCVFNHVLPATLPNSACSPFYVVC